MTTCGTISKNLTLAECGNSVAGIEASFVLMNFDDIDRSESTETGDVLSNITMKDGNEQIGRASCRERVFRAV